MKNTQDILGKIINAYRKSNQQIRSLNKRLDKIKSEKERYGLAIEIIAGKDFLQKIDQTDYKTIQELILDEIIASRSKIAASDLAKIINAKLFIHDVNLYDKIRSFLKVRESFFTKVNGFWVKKDNFDNDEFRKTLLISKNCEHCGSEFEQESLHQRFCSKKCQNAAFKKTRRRNEIIKN